jgi:hypothetical protein
MWEESELPTASNLHVFQVSEVLNAPWKLKKLRAILDSKLTHMRGENTQIIPIPSLQPVHPLQMKLLQR